MVMKSVYTLACLLCLGAFTGAAAGAVSVGGHPIEKVIKLLDGLKQESIAEGKKEEQAYSQFARWCMLSIKELKNAISDEKERIAELEDLISGKTKEKEVLEKQIETLEDQLGELAKASAKADKIRKDEAKAYSDVLSDVKATIQAVDVALQAVSGAGSKTEAMLLAKSHVKKVISLISLSSSTTDVDLSALQAFADQRPKQLAAGDAAAHEDNYDFKSENVIELLKGLKTKFQDEKLQATKEETNAINAYDLAKQSREAAQKAAENSKKEKETTLADTKKDIEKANGELKDQQADKKADSKGLADTNEACDTKKAQWEARSEVRDQELAAMDVAKKILAKATGVRTKAPENPIPPASPAFLQIVSDDAPKMAAVQVIRDAAKSAHSKALERLAVAVSAHLSGPFDQVNNMIEKMIFRLMDEQKQEDEHKHWCDQEIEKTQTMLDEKDEKMKKLAAKIKSETSEVGELAEDIKDAEAMIEKIIGFKKEATEIREIGKKENKLAVNDAQTAQKALADAIAVLTDFYKDSGAIPKEPWEFIQSDAPVKLPKNPATWDSEYTGVGDRKKQPSGILTVLETVMTDFAKEEAETKANEAQDQKEYDQSMSDNDIELARRRQESDMKTAEKKRRSENIASLQGQHKDTSGEREKTDQYMTDLGPACKDGDSSYGERKASRTKEIDALKKAQVILLEAFKKKGFLQIKRHEQ